LHHAAREFEIAPMTRNKVDDCGRPGGIEPEKPWCSASVLGLVVEDAVATNEQSTS
jgi:hypothetical protein